MCTVTPRVLQAVCAVTPLVLQDLCSVTPLVLQDVCSVTLLQIVCSVTSSLVQAGAFVFDLLKEQCMASATYVSAVAPPLEASVHV